MQSRPISFAGRTSPSAPPDRGRIDSLDLARGIAVMGIIVINMPGFAGPYAAIGNPDWNGHAEPADYISFSVAWLFFEGKMRALFSLLFGAGLVFFAARRASPGADAVADTLPGLGAQLRRLGWLAVFGYAHYLFLWWGDILLLYAVAGTMALLLSGLSASRLVILGISAALFFSLFAAAMAAPTLMAVDAVEHGRASAEQAGFIGTYSETLRNSISKDLAEYSQGMTRQVALRLGEDPFQPFRSILLSIFETLPLMLIGMGLAKGGFFTGGVGRDSLSRIGLAGILLGLIWAWLSLAWLFSVGFPLASSTLPAFYTGLPGRMAMGVGYLALIVRYAPAWARTGPGRRIAAAGRMAFSNYLLTSVVMTFLFHGWGLGLIDRYYGHATLMIFVAGAWVAMLAWSMPWLGRYGSGPLELAWRRLANLGRGTRNAIGSQ